MSKPKSKLFVLVTIIVLLATAVPAFAGGWATIKLIAVPAEVRAGEETIISFQVWQHDNKLVQSLMSNDKVYPIEPQVSATHVESGQTVTTIAQPNKADLSFEARLTLPEPGTWEWTIEPLPLGGATSFEPLDVQPALEPVPVVTRQRQIDQVLSGSLLFLGAGVLIVLFGFSLFMYMYRRSQKLHHVS
ncbi:MAG: hypothetical protein KDE48_16655 [Anaerolineales bacterium]|nr:hypothetical protein [Anaerolineales bacterium]